VTAIQSAAITSNTPMFGGFTRQLAVDGRVTPAGEKPPDVTMVSVSAKYFETLGMRVLRGRGFNDTDGTAGHEAAIVNQRFVTMHFPGEDPVGRRIKLTDSSPQIQPPPPLEATIVGVVPTVRQRNFQEPDPDPVAYLPYRADPQRFMMLVVRANGEPSRITSLVREEMRTIEPDLPLFQIQTMDQLLAQQRWPFRVFGSMFAIFAVIALVLSAVGLYAVTAYSVTQRTAEIGVRMALGAQSKQVMWLVLKRALVQLAIGTLRYQSRKVFDEVLRHRLRELAGTHVRYGYRRLRVLLRREGWHVNAKRIYRLYREEELIVRTKLRRKMARRRPVSRSASAN
jgi:putative ABC transport system permease protein